MKKIAIFGSKESLEGLKKIEITEENISIIPVEAIKFEEADFSITDFSDYDRIFFGSKRGVKFFLKKTEKTDLKKFKIACVGEKTAEFLEKSGLKADFVPSNNSSEHFFNEFTEKYKNAKGILFPTSDISENTLKERFEKRGIKFRKITVYKTVCADIQLNENIDAFIFLSPSSFKCFLEQNPNTEFKGKTVCAIGKITAEEIEKHGIKCIYPKTFGLKEALKLTISKLGG